MSANHTGLKWGVKPREVVKRRCPEAVRGLKQLRDSGGQAVISSGDNDEFGVRRHLVNEPPALGERHLHITIPVHHDRRAQQWLALCEHIVPVCIRNYRIIKHIRPFGIKIIEAMRAGARPTLLLGLREPSKILLDEVEGRCHQEQCADLLGMALCRAHREPPSKTRSNKHYRSGLEAPKHSVEVG